MLWFTAWLYVASLRNLSPSSVDSFGVRHDTHDATDDVAAVERQSTGAQRKQRKEEVERQELTGALSLDDQANDARTGDDSDAMPSLVADELDRLDVALASARRDEDERLARIEDEKAEAARAAVRRSDVQIEQLLFLRELVRYGASDASVARFVESHPSCIEHCALPCAHAVLLVADNHVAQCESIAQRCRRACLRARRVANVVAISSTNASAIDAMLELAASSDAMLELAASSDALQRMRRAASDDDASSAARLTRALEALTTPTKSIDDDDVASMREQVVVIALPQAWRTAPSERRVAACPLRVVVIDDDENDVVMPQQQQQQQREADVFATRSIDRRDECLTNVTTTTGTTGTTETTKRRLCVLLLRDSGRLVGKSGELSVTRKLSKSLSIENPVRKTKRTKIIVKNNDERNNVLF